MKHPRELDSELVDAYLARRALDYLVGFTLSPVLWRKLPGAQLGRPRAVGGAAHHLRARGRDRGLQAAANTGPSRRMLNDAAGDAVQGAPDRTSTARSSTSSTCRTRPAPPRPAVAKIMAGAPFEVASGRARSRRGAIRSPPFTTSTLQQEASRKLGLRRQPHACASPSSSTRASTSAARRSASSPICGPTASQLRRERSAAARRF